MNTWSAKIAWTLFIVMTILAGALWAHSMKQGQLIQDLAGQLNNCEEAILLMQTEIRAIYEDGLPVAPSAPDASTQADPHILARITEEYGEFLAALPGDIRRQLETHLYACLNEESLFFHRMDLSDTNATPDTTAYEGAREALEATIFSLLGEDGLTRFHDHESGTAKRAFARTLREQLRNRLDSLSEETHQLVFQTLLRQLWGPMPDMDDDMSHHNIQSLSFQMQRQAYEQAWEDLAHKLPDADRALVKTFFDEQTQLLSHMSYERVH